MTVTQTQQGLTDRDYCRKALLSDDSSAWTKYPFPDWFKEAEASLKQLAVLGPGWDSYNAKPISQYYIKLAWEFLSRIAQLYPPKPHVGPVPDGGVQIEWHTNGIDLEVEFSPEDGIVFFFKDKTRTIENELDFNSSVMATIKAIKKLK